MHSAFVSVLPLRLPAFAATIAPAGTQAGASSGVALAGGGLGVNPSLAGSGAGINPSLAGGGLGVNPSAL